MTATILMYTVLHKLVLSVVSSGLFVIIGL